MRVAKGQPDKAGKPLTTFRKTITVKTDDARIGNVRRTKPSTWRPTES